LIITSAKLHQGPKHPPRRVSDAYSFVWCLSSPSAPKPFGLIPRSAESQSFACKILLTLRHLNIPRAREHRKVFTLSWNLTPSICHGMRSSTRSDLLTMEVGRVRTLSAGFSLQGNCKVADCQRIKDQAETDHLSVQGSRPSTLRSAFNWAVPVYSRA
jgi:hypothetical protein